MSPAGFRDELHRCDGHGLPSFHPGEPVRERSLLWIGLWLFLLSLSMLFGASLVGYLVIRLTSESAPAWGFFSVPRLFWVSTPALLAAGAALEAAARAKSRAGRRAALTGACLASVVFVACQTPALLDLYHSHSHASAELRVGLYGLIFTLIALHAAHVIGGLVPLALITYRQCAPGARPVSTAAIRATAVYWHFLDAVWLCMLTMFLLTR